MHQVRALRFDPAGLHPTANSAGHVGGQIIADVQNLPERHIQTLRRKVVHVGKRLGAAIRPGAQHEAEIVAQTEQFRAGVAIGNRHQRPLLRQLRQRIVRFLRDIDAAAPVGEVFHRRIGPRFRRFGGEPGITHT